MLDWWTAGMGEQGRAFKPLEALEETEISFLSARLTPLAIVNL